MYRIEERDERAFVLRRAPLLAEPGSAVTTATIVTVTVGVLAVVTPLGFLLDRLFDWTWLTPLSGAAALAGLSLAGLSTRFVRHRWNPATVVIDRHARLLRLGPRAPDVPFEDVGVPRVVVRSEDEEHKPWYQVALPAGNLELRIGAFDDHESAEREAATLQALFSGSTQSPGSV